MFIPYPKSRHLGLEYLCKVYWACVSLNGIIQLNSNFFVFFNRWKASLWKLERREKQLDLSPCLWRNSFGLCWKSIQNGQRWPQISKYWRPLLKKEKTYLLYDTDYLDIFLKSEIHMCQLELNKGELIWRHLFFPSLSNKFYGQFEGSNEKKYALKLIPLKKN